MGSGRPDGRPEEALRNLSRKFVPQNYGFT